MRIVLRCLVLPAIAAIVVSMCDEASAQYRAGRQLRRQRRSSFSDEPLVSPYINMFNPNADPALNYLMFTQPMLRQQDINQQQRTGLARLQSQVAANEAASPYGFRGIGPTGHRATYMDFSHYYGGGGEGAGGGGGGGFQRRKGGKFGYSAMGAAAWA